jgi:CheY-like chemotaxis protein
MVLHELATNAAKYGALSRSNARLRVSWAAMPEALRLDWVEKAGPPVAGPPTQEGFGTTLMCNILEKQLHGRLEMDWRAEGLRCRVWLPADTWNLSGVIEAPPGGDKPTAISTMTVKGKRRVLVVEDEALTALALQRVLEDAGFNVLGPVARVQDALDLVGTTRPDAAVLDVNLFGETVGPVADVLYKLDVPFLFCTGYHSADNIGDHHARVLVLHKPVNSNDLVTAVGHLFVRGNAGNIQRP